jgi:hypothetical protein
MHRRAGLTIYPPDDVTGQSAVAFGASRPGAPGIHQLSRPKTENCSASDHGPQTTERIAG